MAGWMRNSAVVVIYFYALALQHAATARTLLGASSSAFTLKNHSPCQLASNFNWKPPFCVGGPLNCVVKHLPSSNDGLLKGTCNSSAIDFCSVGEFKFAVGVKAIPPYGPSNCESCTCNLHPELKSRNKAQCDCDPLPPCYVDLEGNTLGDGCPFQIQSQCVITRPFAGKVVNGRITHLGKCIAPQDGFCVSAGPNWGPLFYDIGAHHVPKPGDLCMSCRCQEGGAIGSCKPVACKKH